MEVRVLSPLDFVSSTRLFGSAVRGELDEHSDVDVVVVYKRRPGPLEREMVRRGIAQVYGERVDLAEYEESRIKDFFLQGHLFAWHLKTESVSIVAGVDEFFDSLPHPKPYTAGAVDAESFLELAETSAHELSVGVPANIFELGLMYVAARNFAMCLSAVIDTKPNFCRYAPFALTVSPAFPLTQPQYDALLACRRASRSGARAPSMANGLSFAGYSIVHWMRQCLELIE